MKLLKFFLILGLYILVSSCGNVKEAFTNQKKNSSDEFLVEKKSPLVMPPDYGDLPTPEVKSNDINENSEGNRIQNLLSNNDTSVLENDSNEIPNQNLEKSILEKIKKN